MSGYSGGDLPTNYSGDGICPVQFGQTHITRVGNKTIYQARLHLGELYPFEYKSDQSIRISILVNNNNGRGRAGWLEWSSGIGRAKNAALYGKLKCR